MKWVREHRPSPAIAIALAALVVALGGAAFAAIPDSNGVIHACYQKRSGELRVVEDSQDCRRNREQPIEWNQQGPPGPPGQNVAFDEETAEVSTSSSTFVDLGGPSVTVDVPANGLVAVFARAEMRGAGSQTVGLHEATTFNPAIQVFGGGGTSTGYFKKWMSPGEGQSSGPAAGTTDPLEASWTLLEAGPGTHTYSLQYKNPDSTDTGAAFRNRALWVRPGG